MVLKRGGGDGGRGGQRKQEAAEIWFKVEVIPALLSSSFAYLPYIILFIPFIYFLLWHFEGIPRVFRNTL